MARTVDPERHAARRLMIIDAAVTEFANAGYERTTTAAICARAGIGSGTFFHYFPTKSAALLAILDLGTSEVIDWFAAREPDADPSTVIRAWAAHTADELREPRLAGFVNAVGAVMGDPEVAAALERDDAAQRDGLRPLVARARTAGLIRDDLVVERIVDWLLVLMDGFISRMASDPSFTADSEGPIYLDIVDRFLAASSAAER
ncbi:TetR/AcrR family transcriptional regulator [Millisia brevis]|uniref:TetR/AcrR family transcriptional regulator n=1 Tax=Millisia brevis TaxID=264148 RepID=UPI000837A20A|nr:TetR/AcrR family transcriptional regulator [Millisia brevis]